MSNSYVKFLNVNNFEVDLDRHRKIPIEYIVDKDVQVSQNDWIAIYPQGANIWNSFNIDLMVAYEFVLSALIRKEERKYKMEFSLKGANKLKYGQMYQFVYMSRSSDIYGISEAFEFHPPDLNKIPEQLYFSQESNDASKENSGDCATQFNDKKKKISLNRRTRQPLVKVELDKSESEDNKWSADHNKREAKIFINKFNKSKQVFMKSPMEMCSNNKSCGIHSISPPISCSNCHRVPGLLRTQQELYNEIKNMAEINNDLRNQVARLQRQAELNRAACQKLSVTLMRERQAKLFYQSVTYERAEYEYQIMVMEPFVPTVFVPTRKNLHPPDKHRAEEKAKIGCSVLKLKAIIGNQEERIRSLMKEIEDIKINHVQRVSVVVRDIKEVNNSNEFDSKMKESEITSGNAAVEVSGSGDVDFK